MQQYSSSLSACLWSFQQAGLFCDTAVITKNGVEIPAHAAVLAASSSQLYVALQQSCSTFDAPQCYKLDLRDYEDQTMLAVLKYIYTGDTSVLAKCSSVSKKDASCLFRRFKIGFVDNSSTNHQELTDSIRNLSANDGAELIDSCNEDDRCWQVLDEEHKVRLGIDDSLEPSLAIGQGSRFDERSHQTSGDSANRTSEQQPLYRRALLADFTGGKTGIKSEIISDSNSESKDLLNIVVTIRNKTACSHTTSRTRALCRKRGKCRRQLVISEKLQSQRVNSHSHKSIREDDTANQDAIFDCLLQEPSCKADSMLYEDVDAKEQEATRSNNVEKTISRNVERNFVCDICNRDFIFAAHLRRHKANHENVETGQYACAKCDSRFCRRSQLLRHEIQHTGVWPARCSICGSGFLSEATLAEHFGKSHRVLQPYACENCGRRFVLEENLVLHARLHIKRSDRALFKCATCSKTFRCAAYLRNHEQVHTGGPRPFVCDVCGKGFMGNSNLTTHRRIHTGERPYACTVCNKRFLQLCAVREHEKIHSGLKQFVCDVCGKQFMTYAQLYNHGRIHVGVKSFECDNCEKRFYTNGDLIKHARIHADRRPFVCDVCGKAFKYSSNLHGHARIHTGARPYVCSTCGKGFVYSSHLSRHVKLHVRDRAASAAAASDSNQLNAATDLCEMSDDVPSTNTGAAASTPVSTLQAQGLPRVAIISSSAAVFMDEQNVDVANMRAGIQSCFAEHLNH